MRIRSPGYPSINLQQAIDITGKIFEKNRMNVLDREAAAKDAGFSGITGRSAKVLSDLGHFGLIEKAGKGGLRVTPTAAAIMHPRDMAEFKKALWQAAFTPDLYADIQKNWPDGFVSENALRSYLIRRDFSGSAVQPALTSYQETYQFLQQMEATESHRREDADADNGGSGETPAKMEPPPGGSRGELVVLPPTPPAPPDKAREGVKIMDGERVVFIEESGPSQYLKLVASGDLDETMLEALEDYIKRQKKRLAPRPAATPSVQ